MSWRNRCRGAAITHPPFICAQILKDGQARSPSRGLRSPVPACTSLTQRSAKQSIHHTAELDEQAIARRLDEPAVMVSDLGMEHLGVQRLEPAERLFLVGFGQA